MIQPAAQLSEVREQVIELARGPQGLGLLALVAGVVVVLVGVFWLYQRESRLGAGAPLRMALATLRSLVLVGLLLIFLEPVSTVYTRQTLRATTAVLVDVSGSMNVADQVDGSSVAPRARIAAVSELLTRGQSAWLREQASRNLLRVYTFGETVREVDSLGAPASNSTQPRPEQAVLSDALAATSPATDIGAALARVFADVGDAPIAGVVIFSDGVVTQGSPADDLGRLAVARRAAIVAVGAGAEREPPNLRIAALTAPTTVPMGDPVELRIDLASSFEEQTAAQVEVVAERFDSSGASLGRQPLGTQSVQLGGAAGASASVLLPATLAEAGQYVIQARLSATGDHPPEAIVTDNLRETSLSVVDEKLRALVVAGRPTFDYRFLVKLLERDRTVDVSCWLQSADARAVRDGDIVITELPRKSDDLLAYDVIVLIDPDPRELDGGWVQLVRRLVDELGGGLLYQAGPHFSTRLLADERLVELVNLLAVAPDPQAEVRLTSLGAYRATGATYEVPDDALTHPLVAFAATPGESRSIWNALPGAYWHLPVSRAKPLATVLLQYGGGRAEAAEPVLFAVQPFGSGRTAFLATDSLWRWRATGEHYFNRFWIQTLRYLAQARRQSGNPRGSISFDRESPQSGEVVRIEARVLDPGFAPWHEQTIQAKLRAGDGSEQAIELSAIPEREGWYSARIIAQQPGSTMLQLELPGGPTSQPAVLARRFMVTPPDRELQRLALARDELTRLAQATGGQYIALADALAAPPQIPDATVEKPPVRGPVEPLWDRTWIMLVIAALLATEWALRRRNYLL